MALTRKERLGLMSARRAALDVKAAQSDLDGKAAVVHSHAISDVSGLQTALDGKQPTGSYVLTVNYSWDALPGKPSTFPPSAHSHVIADVTGLQTALDAKLATANFTWNSLSGKPTTFAPSAHSHAISDVSGLQTALDGKQPVGSYLTGITSGMVTTALGFTPANKAGDAFSGPLYVNNGSHQVTIASDGNIEVARSGGGAYIDLKDSTGEDFDVRLQASGTALAIAAPGGLTLNGAAVLTGITSGQVATALGYTPANKAGDTFTGTVTIPDLVVSDSMPVFSSGLFQYHQFQSPHVAFVKKTGGYQWYWRRSDTGLAGGANEVEDMSLTEGGSLIVRTDIRAPQFLDSEDTSYYLNPTGTSNLAGLAVANTITGNISGGANTANFLNGGASSTDVDNITNRVNSGFWQSSTGTTAEGWPLDSGGWQHMISCTHSNNSNYFAMQLGAGFFDQGLFYRSTNGGGSTPWSRVALYGNNYAGNLYASVYYDSNDTSRYVDPTGCSKLWALGVAAETAYPGSINGDYDGGYYHFGPSNDTPTGSYGHAHIIRLDANWNVQMFFPTSNNNEPMWIRRKQNGTYSTWRRMLQEDEWIGSKYLASDGRIYGTIFYDSDNSGYYVDPASTSNLNDIRGSYIRCYGSVDVDSDLYVGTASGKTSSYIYMKDSDEGDRAIHCNSNRIGFLRQDGGWGAWCEDDGSWRNTSYIQTPIIYDINNTGYYVDPAGSSFLNAVTFDGLAAGRTSASTDVNSANDTGSFSVRGSTTTVAAMSFHRAGAYAMNMGLGTDNVFRIGGWSASSNCFQMDGSGNLTVLGNVTAYSDARLKKDVETISGALDMVSAMRGVRYTRIDSGQRQVGVIAQEMQEIVPEVVQQGIGDDDTLSVAYGNLVGVLIEAVKELRAEVEALKSQGTMK